MSKWETIKGKLRKILALAESGHEGERVQANRLLDALCSKYRISREDLLCDEKRFYVIPYKNKFEKRVVQQCCALVTGSSTVAIWRHPKKRNVLVLKLTAAENADLLACLDHFLPKLPGHLDDAVSAFIHAHRIFASGDSQDLRELSPADLVKARRVLQMANGIASDPWVKKSGELCEVNV